MDNMGNLSSLNKYLGLDKMPTSSYEFGGKAYTTQELWCKISEKINIIIEHFNYLDKNFKDEQTLNKEKFDYLLGQGLSEVVARELLNKINDGSIGKLINETLLTGINTKLDNEVLRINSQLDDIAINVKSFGAVGDGVVDDTMAFIKAIEKAYTTSCKVFVPKTQNGYLVKDIEVKQGVSIISNCAKILNNGMIGLLGNNNIDNIEFDGQMSTQGIVVKGSNCNIINSIFKNIKNTNKDINGGLTTAILVLDNISNIQIIGNVFDTIEPYLEGSSTETHRSARMIRIQHCNNVKIKMNIFKNANGVSDTDYVHFWSGNNTIANTNYPFFGYEHGELKGVKLEDNIFYFNHCKSNIKIQASNVQILRNEFYTDDTLGENSYTEMLRVYNANGGEIRGNKFFINASKITNGISINNSQNITISDNEIIDTTDKKKIILYFNHAKNIVCNNNIIKFKYLETGDTPLYFRGTKNIDFMSNDITIDTQNVVDTLEKSNPFIYVVNSPTSGAETENITIKANKVYSTKLNTKSKNTIKCYTQVSNVIIKDNVFNCEFMLEFYSVNGLLFENNFLKSQNNYPLIMQSSSGTITNVTINNNTFDNLHCNDSTTFIIFRCYNVIEKCSFTNNNVTIVKGNLQPFYDSSAGKIFYSRGNFLGTKFDCGSTGDRPTCDLQVGHSYFDKTLNKMVYKISNGWIDSSGQTA